MSAPLNDTEAARLMALWEADRIGADVTAAERVEMDALAKRLPIRPGPKPPPPPGTPHPTIIVPKPHWAEVICQSEGGGGPML